MQIKEIYNLLEKFSDITEVKKENLSIIWDNIQECFHIRSESKKLQFIIDFLNKNITFKQLIHAIDIWENPYDKESYKDEDEKLNEYLNNYDFPPNDLTYDFYFYDSY